MVKLFNSFRTFLSASYIELKDNVTWTKLSTLQSNAVLVLIASLIFALIIGLVDLSFKSGLKTFYDSF